MDYFIYNRPERNFREAMNQANILGTVEKYGPYIHLFLFPYVEYYDVIAHSIARAGHLLS